MDFMHYYLIKPLEVRIEMSIIYNRNLLVIVAKYVLDPLLLNPFHRKRGVCVRTRSPFFRVLSLTRLSCY
ncbi:hypothetical protein Natoc_1230 [Natronococcus occultus SP4]|uniref:Uncharacterized protein n=1 Tax=Natronococcus occultus SP4 TaxID=694430 RepID=L0JWA9_9EURY|nr:hypothetical protein Natoc_1230 [Natronococcus occultus SP4]